MSEILGRVHSVESFGSVDGPGIRYLIFLQGCAFRCQYCHNADTWALENKETQYMSAKELITQAKKYKAYWGNKGGITVSGGEPLLQIDFLIELFKLAKQEGISTCIDTAGQPFSYEEPFFSKFEELMSLTDLLLVDIKHIDPSLHVKLTGQKNDNIIEMFRYLDRIHKPIWIRHVLLDGYTNDEHWLNKTREFIDTLSNVEKIDVLPYHSLGVHKWLGLGLEYPLGDLKGPSQEDLKKAIDILTK